jgi:hypothetical protein
MQRLRATSEAEAWGNLGYHIRRFGFDQFDSSGSYFRRDGQCLSKEVPPKMGISGSFQTNVVSANLAPEFAAQKLPNQAPQRKRKRQVQAQKGGAEETEENQEEEEDTVVEYGGKGLAMKESRKQEEEEQEEKQKQEVRERLPKGGAAWPGQAAASVEHGEEEQERECPEEKEEQQMESGDFVLKFSSLYAKVRVAREKVRAAVDCENFTEAEACCQRLNALKSQIGELRVCRVCWAFKASPAALLACREKWYGSSKAPICSFCRTSVASMDLDSRHAAQAQKNLAFRGWVLLHAAKKHLTAECAQSKQKKKKVQQKLAACEQEFRPQKLGQGKGVRCIGKEVPLVSLVAQVHRLRAQVACEPCLQHLHSALLLALEALGGW